MPENQQGSISSQPGMVPGVSGLPVPVGAALYLSLLKQCVLGLLRPQLYVPAPPPENGLKRAVYEIARNLVERNGRQVMVQKPYCPIVRWEGRECWPLDADTMLGMPRLDNVQSCVEQAVLEGIPGDLMEAGVWKGGTVTFMRGALEALGDKTRRVWVADSFEGLPPPDAKSYPADARDEHSTWPELAASLEDVKQTFQKYNLLDDRVCFLKGWFKDTLPTAPIEQLAVLRVDGDMYGSTWEALEALYPRLAPGGFCIIDDYKWYAPCAQAVEDYRARHGITEPILDVDYTAVYWRRNR